MARPRGKGVNRYSVYDRRTDMPVIIGGTARECAGVMGVTVPSFRTIYNSGTSGKWRIIRYTHEALEENL